MVFYRRRLASCKTLFEVVWGDTIIFSDTTTPNMRMRGRQCPIRQGELKGLVKLDHVIAKTVFGYNMLNRKWPDRSLNQDN